MAPESGILLRTCVGTIRHKLFFPSDPGTFFHRDSPSPWVACPPAPGTISSLICLFSSGSFFLQRFCNVLLRVPGFSPHCLHPPRRFLNLFWKVKWGFLLSLLRVSSRLLPRAASLHCVRGLQSSSISEQQRSSGVSSLSSPSSPSANTFQTAVTAQPGGSLRASDFHILSTQKRFSITHQVGLPNSPIMSFINR